MACFDTEMFCKYIDNALDVQQHEGVRAHLLTCQRCAEQLRMLAQHDTMLRSILPTLPALDVPVCSQYKDEDRSAYASKLMTSQEVAAFEPHLQTCDACLGEVMAIYRTLELLQRAPLLTPPATLVTAVERMPAPTALREHLGAVIIQVAQQGLQFLEALSRPTHVRLTVRGHLLPAGAFRHVSSDVEAAALLDIRQSTGDLDLSLTALHEEKATVRLTVQVQRQAKPLVAERISLYREGRLQYSSKTSAHGEVTFARLTPGEYTIRLSQAQVETQCILRAASGATPSA